MCVWASSTPRASLQRARLIASVENRCNETNRLCTFVIGLRCGQNLDAPVNDNLVSKSLLNERCLAKLVSTTKAFNEIVASGRLEQFTQQPLRAHLHLRGIPRMGLHHAIAPLRTWAAAHPLGPSDRGGAGNKRDSSFPCHALVFGQHPRLPANLLQVATRCDREVAALIEDVVSPHPAPPDRHVVFFTSPSRRSLRLIRWISARSAAGMVCFFFAA